MKNAYFGARNLHIAPMKDESALTYDTPVSVPGTISIGMEPQTSSDPAYADDGVWVENSADNGFDITLTNFDMETDPTIRELYARMVGYDLDDKNRLLYRADKQPEPFALLCEEEATSTQGRRKCLLKCTAEKPSQNAETTTDSRTLAQNEITIHARPVVLANGIKLSGYTDYPGSTTYDDFFDAVSTSVTLPTTPSTPTE